LIASRRENQREMVYLVELLHDIAFSSAWR